MSAPVQLDRFLLPVDVEPGGPLVLARAEWPATAEDTLPGIAGFIVSSFNPLVAEVAERCLTARYSTAPADADRGLRTGLVLASIKGDVGTAEAIAAAVEAGRRVPPLLFFQSNPNAVLGHIAARWQLRGPVVCTSPGQSAVTDGLAVAALMIADGDADEVLVIAADQAEVEGGADHAVALLVGGGSATTPGPILTASQLVIPSSELP